jgi:DtxR family transcriptional regulator, Mn-dependent transcriptional regulator
MLTSTEENYLKSLLKLTIDKETNQIGTNELASFMDVKPATVNDMLKKLKEKNMVQYEKYGKITLSDSGRMYALNVIRKHRLWETFLYEKLSFTWDEVHEVAEQLEHIQSIKLIEKLDQFLKFPEFDPHGDPIPNANGEYKNHFKKTLSQIEVGHSCKMVSVKDNSSPFLQYVVKVGLGLNNKIKVISKQDYDDIMVIEVNGKQNSVSKKFTENIFVVCNKCKLTETCVSTTCDLK